MNPPLHGRLILDCSVLLPGPTIGKLLVQQGARVIKVESPDHPDGAKAMGSFYADLNERKEIVSLSLHRPEDRARFAELVRKADGLIEAYRPQTKQKLGLDEATLHAINPKLCIASLVGYSEEGPWRDRAGHDLNFAAVTGCLSLYAEMSPLPLGDLFAAFSAALSLTAAIDAVSRGAPGRRIVVSISETLKQVQSSLVREHVEEVPVAQRAQTLLSGQYPCYRVYLAADGRRISVGAVEGKFWKKFCEVIKKPELTSEGYATGERGQAVITAVQAALGARAWSEWAPLFEAADCCVEPVLTYSELYPRHGIQS